MSALARLVASGFGSGYVRRAPGTAGSLLALLIGAVLLWVGPTAVALAAALAVLGGWWAVRAVQAGDDPGWVVADEFAGQWIALLGLARPTLAGLTAAFVLFRVLDIAKPGPVGWADRQHGPMGVMADDVIAGAIAAALLLLFRFVFPGILD